MQGEKVEYCFQQQLLYLQKCAQMIRMMMSHHVVSFSLCFRLLQACNKRLWCDEDDTDLINYDSTKKNSLNMAGASLR